MSEGEVVEAALRHLIAISAEVGDDPALAQASGGNTSVKTGDGRSMYIKASGVAIRDISATHGWRRLRVACVRRIAADQALAKLPPSLREREVARRLRDCCDDGFGGDAPPSIESLLHAVLGRCAVHLHAVAVGPYLCSRQGRSALERLFTAEQPPPLWVPYADPGYRLARTAARLIAHYARRRRKAPGALFLQRHGLVVSASTPRAALRLANHIIGRCRSGLPQPAIAPLSEPPASRVAAAERAVRRALMEVTGERVAARRLATPEVAGFLSRADARQLLSTPALTPEEHAVAQGPPLWVDRWEENAIADALRRRTAAGEPPPLGFLGQDIGLIVAGSEHSIATIGEVIAAFLLVRQGAVGLGGPNPLTRRQRDRIARWRTEVPGRAAG